jgi:hypothetical protein
MVGGYVGARHQALTKQITSILEFRNLPLSWLYIFGRGHVVEINA